MNLLSRPHWWSKSPTIRPVRLATDAHVRLFCFPYAGGSPTAFCQWPDFFPAGVEICSIHLPRRGERLSETPLTRIGPVVDSVCASLAHCSEKPFAFFGHSLGALIAFEVSRKLAALGAPGPIHLFASACPGPPAPRRKSGQHLWPEGVLIEYLRGLNGTPDELFRDREFLDCVLPAIRADLEMIETYEYMPAPALQCPITALGGVDDPEVSRIELEAWRSESSGDFSLKMFPGDHFYIHRATPSVAEVIQGAFRMGRFL
ncbi:MAG: putative thioesterase [Acidobacteria bacterium]|nr:putative thioesterase [Acidobacteriota bacterium]